MTFLIYHLKKINLKFKFFGVISKGGRNFLGRICVKGRGNGQKKIYQFIDFFRRINLFGIILKFIYDCNRTCLLALILYTNGFYSLIPASNDTKLYDEIYSGRINKNINSSLIGWAVPVQYITPFSIINNIELIPYNGSKLVRSAGSSALIIGRFKNKVIIKLVSGWELKINQNCIATLGIVSNTKHKFKIIGSAGKARNLGFRPKVRGVAMNPCDHPHGGGNGKRSKPVVPVNAFGSLAKWTPTKNTKKDILKRRYFKKI
jgi:large subunit ribosomal protein L2